MNNSGLYLLEVSSKRTVIIKNIYFRIDVQPRTTPASAMDSKQLTVLVPGNDSLEDFDSMLTFPSNDSVDSFALKTDDSIGSDIRSLPKTDSRHHTVVTGKISANDSENNSPLLSLIRQTNNAWIVWVGVTIAVGMIISLIFLIQHYYKRNRRKKVYQAYPRLNSKDSSEVVLPECSTLLFVNNNERYVVRLKSISLRGFV